MFALTSLQIKITLLLLFFPQSNHIHHRTITIIHWQFQVTLFLLETLNRSSSESWTEVVW